MSEGQFDKARLDDLEAALEVHGWLSAEEAKEALAEIERGWAEIKDLRRTVNDGIEITHDQAIKNEALKGEVERLKAELAGQSKAATDWREAAERHMARAEALRPGLTEEEAREIAADVATSFNARWSIGLGQGPLKDMADRIETGVLRASRGDRGGQ